MLHYEKLKDKNEYESLISDALRDPSIVLDLLEIINKEKGSIKFSASKILRLISESYPEVVYPHFDEIKKLLYSENSFIKWDGISIISNLVKVDQDLKFDLIFDSYFDLISCHHMITAGNVVGSAWKIIKAKPEIEPEITRRILEIPDIIYYNEGEPSPECNNILCGHAIDCFEKYFDESDCKEEIIEFVKNQLNNPRKAVVKRAEKFLKKFNQ